MGASPVSIPETIFWDTFRLQFLSCLYNGKLSIKHFLVKTYPICVFPTPGAPQNSVIFPTGTPPPNMSSSCSQKVTMLPDDCSCCRRSKAFLLPDMTFDTVFPVVRPDFEVADCADSVELLIVWMIFRPSSLSTPRSVGKDEQAVKLPFLYPAFLLHLYIIKSCFPTDFVCVSFLCTTLIFCFLLFFFMLMAPQKAKVLPAYHLFW